MTTNLESLKSYSAAIKGFVAAHKEELAKDLQAFIRIPSFTYQEGNAVKFLADKMKNFDFDEVRIDPVGNLLGRVGHGKTVLLYDSHIDTVTEGDASAWAHPPFEGVIENGTIYGRGAVDDKGCLMGITYAARALKSLDFCNDFTLWISASISEEDVEGACVESMMKLNPDIQPNYILVAEASENQIIRGHKGRALVRITVNGKAAHASAAWMGENALIKAIPIMQRVDKCVDLPEDPFLGKGTIEVTRIDCDSPSLNTIPGKVTVTCDRRISAGESVEALLEEAKLYIGDTPGAKAAINTEAITSYTGYPLTCLDYFPSWVLEETHPYVQAAIETYRLLFNKAPVITKWDFCTNATQLCGRTGISTIGFGPGVEALCHTYEDQLPLAELEKAVEFYSLLPLVIISR